VASLDVSAAGAGPGSRPLGQHVVSRDARGGPVPRCRARIHVPAGMHLASCAGTGIAAGIGVAAIRPGAGAGWPALQWQHAGDEIEEVRDKEACLSASFKS
jgi:hypothetical protein